MINFSFLLPTRERPDLIKRFFQSIIDTSAHPENLELVLAVDEDDLLSQAITHESLKLTKVVMKKGATMGALNRACYDASVGRYVMLINDDVILRTKDWDKIIYKIFAQFDDDIALIHTNDLLFQEKLCTFPILSRKACDKIGICPAEYKRYRIDDHIYDTYNILAHLGHKRIFYLPDVIFEHDNFAHKTENKDKHIFKATENKIYVPNQEIITLDAAIFDKSLEKRKQDALDLALLIEQPKKERIQSAYKNLLSVVNDPYGYRRANFVTKLTHPDNINDLISEKTATLTIGVVTSDIQKPHAVECLARIKKFTSNYDLVILDNNGGKEFNHPREMNKLLRIAKTDYLVLMDDDVFVEESWVQGIMKGFDLDKNAGVVTPMHKDKNGKLSYSGVYFMGNQYGMHAHLLDVPDRPRETQTLCSAIMMIDMARCGHIRVNEAYNKYFLDIDYGLNIWHAGYKVLCSPYTTVTHIGGATLNYSSMESQKLWNKDMRIFIEDWIKTDRLLSIEKNLWSKYSTLHLLTSIPKRINSLVNNASTLKSKEFNKEVEALLNLCSCYNLFMVSLKIELEKCLAECRGWKSQQKRNFCEKVLAKMKDVALIPPGFAPILIGAYRNYNIVEYEENIYGLPHSLGELCLYKEKDRNKPGIFVEKTKEKLIDIIKEKGSFTDKECNGSHEFSNAEEPPILLSRYKDFNLVRYKGRVFGVPISLGPLDLKDEKSRNLPEILLADDESSVKTLIDTSLMTMSMSQDSLKVNEHAQPEIENLIHTASINHVENEDIHSEVLKHKDEKSKELPENSFTDDKSSVKTLIDTSLMTMSMSQDSLKVNEHAQPEIKNLIHTASINHVENEDIHSEVLKPKDCNQLDIKFDNLTNTGTLRLIEEGYKGFNIIRTDNLHFAIPQGEGDFNMNRIQSQQYSMVYTGNSTEDVKRKISRDSFRLYFMRLKRRLKRLSGF